MKHDVTQCEELRNLRTTTCPDLFTLGKEGCEPGACTDTNRWGWSSRGTWEMTQCEELRNPGTTTCPDLPTLEQEGFASETGDYFGA
eukprot:jgi/Psemu1/24613/gm1.24613_g